MSDLVPFLLNPWTTAIGGAIAGGTAGVVLTRYFDRPKPNAYVHQVDTALPSSSIVDLSAESAARLATSIWTPVLPESVLTTGECANIIHNALQVKARTDKALTELPDILSALQKADVEPKRRKAIERALAWTAVTDLLLDDIVADRLSVPALSDPESKPIYYAEIQEPRPPSQHAKGELVVRLKDKALGIGQNLHRPYVADPLQPLLAIIRHGDCKALFDLLQPIPDRLREELARLELIFGDLQEIVRSEGTIIATGTVANWGTRPFVIEPAGRIDFRSKSGGAHSVDADISIQTSPSHADKYQTIRGCAIVAGDSTCPVALVAKRPIRELGFGNELVGSSLEQNLSARISVPIAKDKNRRSELQSDWVPSILFDEENHPATAKWNK